MRNIKFFKTQTFFKSLKKFGQWFAYGIYHWITFSQTSRPRRILKKIFFDMKYKINQYPKLKYFLLKILDTSPSLKNKLKNISKVGNVNLKYQNEELTWQAQHIYEKLKLEFNRSVAISSINDSNISINISKTKSKLALVSPFPPDQTGIADYSHDLIDSLLEIYDVDIIVQYPSKIYCGIYSIRSVEFFKSNNYIYDVIIYQIGNSPFHAHMFELLAEYPGISVLHDFYIGNLVHWMQWNYPNSYDIWDSMLLDDYGYAAKYQQVTNGINNVISMYPMNANIFKYSKGILLHSLYAKNLSSYWFNGKFDKKIHTVSQVHKIPNINIQSKRMSNKEKFLVCSFGHITKTKLIHKIISVWPKSSIGQNINNKLVFVGGISNYEYGKKIIRMAEKIPNIEITGFLTEDKYQNYLQDADLAIQLRSESKGETSRAVLDCMSYGIPTIVNANGSMDELSENAVYKIQDEFEEEELILALNNLYEDGNLSYRLGLEARNILISQHDPRKISTQLSKIIDTSYNSYQDISIKQFCTDYLKNNDFPSLETISDLARQLELKGREYELRSIYIDISAVAINDLKTGIQRVVRSVLIELLKIQCINFRIIPVYLADKNGHWHYRTAHKFMNSLLSDLIDRPDTKIEPSEYDIFLGLDYYANATIEAVKFDLFSSWKKRGTHIHFVVYDMLPIQFPEFFPPTSHEEHMLWLLSVGSVADSLVCISNTVAFDVENFLRLKISSINHMPNVTFFHLGADIENSIPSKGLHSNFHQVIDKLKTIPSFLTVGTIEPRKGHMQILTSFEILWENGLDINLVIIGKQGWMVEGIIDKIKKHKQLNKRLYWLRDVSDEYLEKIYEASTCLIAASEGEGFGLPLIEAAQHKLPIIARDIPVFREVAGEYAHYFDNDNSPEVLAHCIKSWLELYKNNEHPKSNNMPWLTWEESTSKILQILLDAKI